ncbi:MAG: hypothetical protein U0325_20725 [Polyangiales bacterium]
MSLHTGALTAALTLGAACASAPRPTPDASSRTPDALRLNTDADRADGVGVYTSIPWGFETNTFWLEGPSGVVVIDTQFLPSEAARALAHIEHVTGKRVVLAVVLHPNPDKFNGADVYRAHGTRVISSAQVVAAIPAVAAQRRRAFQSRYAPDYPSTDPVVEPFGDASTTLDAAGLSLRLHVLGQGCSEAHVVVTWNGHLFGGDLLVSQTHAWLELGYVDAWRARVREMRAMAPRRVHPGRGPSGDITLLDETDRYLARAEELVRDGLARHLPVEQGVEAARAALVQAYPAHGYPVFLFGLRRVWERLAAP